MPRTVDVLPSGVRITDFVSFGVLSKCYPKSMIEKSLESEGRQDQRKRDLPGHIVVYYVLAMALYMKSSSREILRCLLEGLHWLMGPGEMPYIAGKSGISQARTRIGSGPLKRIYREMVKPIAGKTTKGAYYRSWRMTSIDGSSMEVADTPANEKAFGRPGASRGKTAYPQFRWVSLVENGTHVLFNARQNAYAVGEATIAWDVVKGLEKGMLCLADRGFYSFKLWQHAKAQGADLLWRVKKNQKFEEVQRLHDGSFISKIYPNWKSTRRKENGVKVRVIEYTLNGSSNTEPIYRVITSILDPQRAPANELAALYSQRWEIETAIGELKTHLRGPKIVMRSRTPELVLQEFYGLLLTHFAVRSLMHEAALVGNKDPDDLSFSHSVRVIRRKLPQFAAFPP